MPRRSLWAAFAALSIGLSGCAGSSARDLPQCPAVVNYTDTQLMAIQESINRLPKKDALRGAMQDYETLRDDARYCASLVKER
ncbi:MAG TPA: hypothetical protein VIJ42_16820 [Stellaceae bacterium]